MTDVRPAAAPASANRVPRVPALDGLRGVAILGVLLFHGGQLRGGFLGVDLFFALSGYLITDLLLRELEATGGVSLVAFWGRRIRRLLPALATMLAGVTVLVWAAAPPDLVRTTLADGPWVQANLVNWHLLAESAGYWNRFGSARVFEHLWSIAVEEQFYLVWPVLIVLCGLCGLRGPGGPGGLRGPSGSGRRWVAVSAAALSLGSLVSMIVLLDPADPTRVYTGTDTRAFSLLLGAMVATPPIRAAGRWAGPALALLAAGIGTTWVLADGERSSWLYDGGLFAHSLAAALLVGLCVRAPHTAVAKTLAWQPLRWLGQVSYGVYLWHWPVFVLLAPRGWLGAAAAWAVAIGLAALSKYLVEDPVRFRARWARGRRGLLAFVALMAGLAALWLALPAPAPPAIDITGL